MTLRTVFGVVSCMKMSVLAGLFGTFTEEQDQEETRPYVWSPTINTPKGAPLQLLLLCL